ARDVFSAPTAGTAQQNPASQRRYPWGADPDAERANVGESQIGTTSAAGAFAAGASPYGAEELAGNVWEWTRSLWGKDVNKASFVYPYNAQDGRENLADGDMMLRV